MTDIQILNAVKNNNGSIQYTELLNQSLTDAYIDGSADKERINNLIKSGLLEGETRAYCSISLKPEGRLYLQEKHYSDEQEQKIADYTANENAKKSKQDWQIAVFSAIGGAVISGLVGFVFQAISFFFFR